MQNETPTEVLHAMLQYYKSKCSQLEYEFLSHKILSEHRIEQLQQLINEKNSKREPGE
jgi:predicted transcriptional regulator